MTIMKINRYTDPFSRIKRDVLQDARLSWRARGMLAYLLSLPEDWQPRVDSLKKQAPGGIDAIYSIIKELKGFGYIEHVRVRDAAGIVRGGYYIVHEEPINVDGDVNELHREKPEEVINTASIPHRENPDMVKPSLAKPDVLNNKYIKNKTKINNETAASVINHIEADSSASSHQQNAAADYISEIDTVIQSELTPNQLQGIRKLAKNMCEKLNVDEALLFKHISVTVLDSKYFTKAGHDFYKKCNSIRKAMIDGMWTPPASLAMEKIMKINEAQDGINEQIAELMREIDHGKKMIDSFSGDSSKAFWRDQIILSEEKIKKLQAELVNCQT